LYRGHSPSDLKAIGEDGIVIIIIGHHVAHLIRVAVIKGLNQVRDRGALFIRPIKILPALQTIDDRRSIRRILAKGKEVVAAVQPTQAHAAQFSREVRR
jgi:hypothetical protein